MAQSPEIAAGTGFTFEDAIAGYFLSALLAEGYAPGIEGRVVCCVSQQQRDFGEPLDDVIVDFRGGTGERARLSLQVKRALVISAAASNTDFREIIRDSWLTLRKNGFRKTIDRYGVAVDQIAKAKARDLIALCEFARASLTPIHFNARFSPIGNASAAVRGIRDDIISLLTEVIGSTPSSADVHDFLSHFVLIEFDFLHEGATTPPDLMTRLRNCLVPDQADQAPLVWSELRRLARDAAGRSGQFDRPRLVQKLSQIVRLRAAPSLRGDLDKITSLTRTWIADIQNDVGGFHIDRPSLARKLDDALSRSRCVQIRGLPGSGKSVVLRQRLEMDLQRGPALLLKSDRLEGSSWASFAQANGLSNAALPDLLVEVASTGAGTVYIDGIDRIEKEHQGVVLDVVRTILESPLSSEWRIVLSLRDTGIEPLRNWMGQLLDISGLATVDVGILDNKESGALAEARPALHPLLFGPSQVRAIVRRPFFAKILIQSFGANASGPPLEPHSEVDLIDNWWARGGYSATGKDAILRQRAIIEIANARAKHISQPVGLVELTSSTIGMLDQLISDGILQLVQQGHGLRFAHDIFFEWALFHAAIDREDQWLVSVRTFGEPPAIARVVELLSQRQYGDETNGDRWAATLAQIASSGMRSQWTRAWLLGPVALSGFGNSDERFFVAASRNDFEFLRKSLVWFQAEKTVPNANILAAQYPADQRTRLADLLGWPSDVAAWRRFITFLLARVSALPVRLYPDVVSVFEVWQNAFSSSPNVISKALLTQAAVWLREVDTAPTDPKAPTRWKNIKGLSDFRQTLTSLILKSAIAEPEFAEELLKRAITKDRLNEKILKQFLDYAPFLARSHPALLADLTVKALKGELPDDQIAREKKEREASAARRKELEAKPEDERSRLDEMALSSVPWIGSSFSFHDWDTLSLDRVTNSFWPPSPLREPFHSLFAASPHEALRLLTELCNHAMAAWRQLHRHMHESPGTPIPLDLTFPWGTQRFWGCDRVYLWHRGFWGPKPIACAFLALEKWCFAELDHGRDVDQLIQQILAGNECIAILGTAATLVLHTQRVSEVAFPIVMAQRLWPADQRRMADDLTSSGAALMGFRDKSDLPHVEALKTAASRPVRKTQLRWLAPHYVFDAAFSERAKAAIFDFPNNPPFQIEEHQNDPSMRDHYAKQAIEYAELASAENYRAYRTAKDSNEVAIVHVSPSASSPEKVQRAQQAKVTLQEGNLWTWASKSLDSAKIGDAYTAAQAIELAKELDDVSLYTASAQGETLGMRRGAVAATAAVVLHFRDGTSEADLQWAREVLVRGRQAPEEQSFMWTPHAIIPWHQGIFAAWGLASDLREGTASEDAAMALLVLIAHPLEAVSFAALERAFSLSPLDPKLTWAALHLALTLCHIQPTPRDQPRGPSSPTHTMETWRTATEAALSYYEIGSGWPDLPLPPPAWVKLDKKAANHGRYIDDDFTDDDVIDSREAWGEPPVLWYSQYAAKILPLIPYRQILTGDARDPFISFASSMLTWTNEKNSPPWVKPGRRDTNSTRIMEWTREFGRLLGKLCGQVSLEEAKGRFLNPIFALSDDPCWALLSSCVDTYIRVYVYDDVTIPPEAVALLQACLDRLLKSSSFVRDGYRSGRFYGFDEPSLVESLMFVSVEEALGAARYVNGDWSNISHLMPVIDRFVRAGGWIASLMSKFLTLCERSKDFYPASDFADQVLSILQEGPQALEGWHGTLLPARIAGMVQHFAYRDTPMPQCLAERLLRILDLLVDMGDRRSAALQLGESFREVRIT